ncbi:hypothetical protein A9Q99_01175 [Gammaproteobacteria bacterium 45_16_T64]|nr:hypothetical protein A9Q99_01175 [Gammaproteobacteria bacterium 45_16_T64]
MEYELTITTVSLMVVAGIAAGFINTLAGGGSMLTLPVLMLMGMPADIANGTNRLAVFIQALTGAHGFNKNGYLDTSDVMPIMKPMLVGALIGSVIVSYMPPDILKPVLLITMMVMSVVMIIKSAGIFPSDDEKPKKLSELRWGTLGIFLCGFYGGAIQGGVGFVLIMFFSGMLRYGLLQTNAWKMLCILGFGSLSLVVFIIRGQVMWVPGLILSLATIVGVLLSLRFALQAKQETLKRFVLVVIIVVCGVTIVTS